MSAETVNNWLDLAHTREISNRIFEQVTQAGAQADLIFDRKQSFSVKANQGALEEHKLTQLVCLGLRTVKNQKVGTAYVEATDEDALAYLVNQSLINGKYASQAPDEQISSQDTQQATSDEILCPDESVELDEKIAFALDLEQRILAEKKIKSVPYNGLSEVHYHRVICSSQGLFSHSKEHLYTTYAYALAEDSSQNAMAGKAQVGRVFSSLNGEALSQSVAKETLSMLMGSSMSSGHYDVMFSTECLAQIWSAFMLVFSAKSAKEEVNPWREKLGKEVADAGITLYDRPLNKEGFGYKIFDGEGAPVQDTSLIEKGTLTSFLHNTSTANYFKQTTTGHACRGPKSALNVAAHQLFLSPGSADEKALYCDTLFEVTDLAGLHSGANPVTGDFSFGASGYLYKNGEQQQVVRGVTVAGNFYDMLSQIHLIGDKGIWDESKSMCLPKIRFSQLAISGS